MEKLRSIFNFIYGYYLDYRYKVPPASALSFAYYMILSIIPICTLLAFFTPFFPLDIKTAQEILSYYLRPDVTKMVIQLIKPRSLSITTITTLIASIFVVSRGFYQLHRISKNMFPNDKEYPFFIDQGITFLKTILIFILILAVISLLIIFPIFKIIFIDQHNFITRVLFLFIIIFLSKQWSNDFLHFCQQQFIDILTIRLLAVMGFPPTVCYLHVCENCLKRGFLRGASVNTKPDFPVSLLHMTDPYLMKSFPIHGTFDTIIILSSAEAIPNRFHGSINFSCSPVRITMVGHYASKILKYVIFIFHRSLQPVFAIQIHNDTALVKSVMALLKFCSDNKTEILLFCLHLEHWRIVILEMIVCSLPQIRMRFCCDCYFIITYAVCFRLPDPLKFLQIQFAPRFLFFCFSFPTESAS